jgi:hypothetical protein
VRLSNLFGQTNPESSQDSDRGFEVALGRLLGIGVLASTMCLAAGLVMTLAASDSRPARLLLSAGLMLLMATPAARVLQPARSVVASGFSRTFSASRSKRCRLGVFP